MAFAFVSFISFAFLEKVPFHFVPNFFFLRVFVRAMWNNPDENSLPCNKVFASSLFSRDE